MLAVVHVALLRVVALVIYPMLIVRCIGIPVTHIAVSTGVGLLVGFVESVVADVGMVIDDCTQGSLQGFAALSIGVLVIRLGTIRSLCPCTQHGHS